MHPSESLHRHLSSRLRDSSSLLLSGGNWAYLVHLALTGGHVGVRKQEIFLFVPFPCL